MTTNQAFAAALRAAIQEGLQEFITPETRIDVETALHFAEGEFDRATEDLRQQLRRAEEFRVYLVQCNTREVNRRRDAELEVATLRAENAQHHEHDRQAMAWLDDRGAPLTDATGFPFSVYGRSKALAKKLYAAIHRAGFAVLQTSGEWSIHDASDAGKKEQERTNAVIVENVDLTQRVRELEAGLRQIAYLTDPELAESPARPASIHAKARALVSQPPAPQPSEPAPPTTTPEKHPYTSTERYPRGWTPDDEKRG